MLRRDGTLKPDVVLRPPGLNHGSGSWFGVRVQMESTCGLLLVGAWHASGDGFVNNGRAYVYHFEGSGKPVLSQVLAASDQNDNHSFGTVAMVPDGSTIAVGSYGYDGATGCVYMFQKSAGGVFTEIQAIRPTKTGLEPGDCFGLSVCMDETATWVLVGAPQYGKQCGAAYIFEKDSSARVWMQRARVELEECDRRENELGEFGEFVAMEQRARYCAIAAPTCGGGRGIVYLLDNTNGSWELGEKLTPPSVPPGKREYFGTSIAMSGNRMFISSPGHDEKKGCVYVLERKGERGSFEFIDTIEMPDGQRTEGRLFGVSLSCSTNGELLFVSAPGHSFLSKEGEKSHVGSVLLFQDVEGEWIHLATIQDEDRFTTNDEFGLSISASDRGDAIAIGAWKSGQGENSEEGSVSFLSLPIKK
mmetsp:Transcript_1172/g.2394  ORF Transcript_1172/g.2394 Transcript_1172/m.2394 type:complete len:418 (-) Transcript_1172:3444-4697(-)|eukprot:jgi/Picre1/33079/NNA_008405.t1